MNSMATTAARCPRNRFSTASREMEARQQERLATMTARGQLRSLVDRLDGVIDACEDAHLRQIRFVTDQLAADAHAVYMYALSVLTHAGGARAERVVRTAERRAPKRIDDLMDHLWTVEETALDLLAPARHEILDLTA